MPKYEFSNEAAFAPIIMIAFFQCLHFGPYDHNVAVDLHSNKKKKLHNEL